MRILNYIIPLLLTLLIGCGEADKPQTYVFDANDMEKKFKQIYNVKRTNGRNYLWNDILTFFKRNT